MNTASSTLAQSTLPLLETQGAATPLIFDKQPFLVLSGELDNNSATSLEYMEPIWPKLAALHYEYGSHPDLLAPDR